MGVPLLVQRLLVPLGSRRVGGDVGTVAVFQPTVDSHSRAADSTVDSVTVVMGLSRGPALLRLSLAEFVRDASPLETCPKLHPLLRPA